MVSQLSQFHYHLSQVPHHPDVEAKNFDIKRLNVFFSLKVRIDTNKFSAHEKTNKLLDWQVYNMISCICIAWEISN